MKKDDFTRLTYAARWRMPPAEAEELLSDYREILEENPRTEEELLKELGRPEEAVRLAAQPGDYCRWLGIFAAMVLCLLLPALVTLIPGAWWLFGTAFPDLSVEVVLLLAGIALSTAYFQKREKGVFPKLLPVLMLLLLVLYAVPGWWAFQVLSSGGAPSLDWLQRILAKDSLYFPWVGQAVHTAFILVGIAAAVLGLWGLIKARVADRRWRALYTLALTVGALVCTTLLLLGGMDISSDGYMTDWYNVFHRCKLIAVIGLIGTGVSLC